MSHLRYVFLMYRENLCKDLYLMSQMDSDQFVPIWTLACMEDIKVLTTDMEIILDVLKGTMSWKCIGINGSSPPWQCTIDDH